MTPEQTQLVDLLANNKWLAATALAIGIVVRLMKTDVKFTPSIPPRWRPLVALGLGIVGGVVDAAARGTPWRRAVLGGVVAAGVAIATHDVAIASLLNGRELKVTSTAPFLKLEPEVPGWTTERKSQRPGMQPGTPPVQVPPQDPPPVVTDVDVDVDFGPDTRRSPPPDPKA